MCPVKLKTPRQKWLDFIYDDNIGQINEAMHSNATASASSEIRAGYSLRNIFPALENRDEAYIEGKNGELRFTNKARAWKGPVKKHFHCVCESLDF